MRINRSIMLSAAMALAVAAPSIADSPHPKPGSQSDNVEVPCNDQGDTVELDGDTLLWPPNHKMVTQLITMHDSGEGQVTFGTTSTHDETVDGEEMNGSGNTAEDSADIDGASGQGSATGELQTRAERSGQGDGREYTVDVMGTAGGDDCTAQFTILVPHDMRPSNRVKPDNGG